MIKLVQQNPTEMAIANLTPALLRNKILVCVFRDEVSIFHRADTLQRFGFQKISDYDNKHTMTEGIENFIKRLNKTDSQAYYLFDNLQELAKTIIEKGWK